MVQVTKKNIVKVSESSLMRSHKIQKRTSKRKQEIKSLYSQLNKVLPSFDNQNHVCGTDVVLKAVQYINQLHRRVANERGVEVLQQIQNNARKIALQQHIAMKAAKDKVRIFILLNYLIFNNLYKISYFITNFVYY